MTVPILSTCWDLAHMTDPEEAKKFTNGLFPNRSSYRSMSANYYAAAAKLSTAQTFDSTPDPYSILQDSQGCSIRLPSQFSAKSPYPEAKYCYGVFNITRYIHRGMMCYQFESTEIDPDTTLDLIEYTLNPQGSGLIYKIFLNNTLFGDVLHYTPIVHSIQTSKLYDSVFAPTKYYKRNENSNMTYLNMDVTFSGVSIKRLSAPYVSNCMDFYPYETSADYLLEKLRKKTIQFMNKTHMLSRLKDRLDVGILSAGSYRNKTILNQFNKLYQRYNGTYLDCDLKYYVSKTSLGYGPVVTVSVYWPQDSEFKINDVAKVELIDFLLYVTSSFGIWLGVSVISLFDWSKIIVSKTKSLMEERRVNRISHQSIHRMGTHPIGKNTIELQNQIELIRINMRNNHIKLSKKINLLTQGFNLMIEKFNQ